MKSIKTYLNILLVAIIVIIITCLVFASIYCNKLWSYYFDYLNYHGPVELADGAWNEECTNRIICTVTCVLLAISFVLSIAVLILLNPRLFRRSTWTNLSAEWKANKQERIAAKQKKAEQNKQAEIAEKQKRLDELQAELDELKDTKSNP